MDLIHVCMCENAWKVKAAWLRRTSLGFREGGCDRWSEILLSCDLRERVSTGRKEVVPCA
jgi:hypothetical protein